MKGINWNWVKDGGIVIAALALIFTIMVSSDGAAASAARRDDKLLDHEMRITKLEQLPIHIERIEQAGIKHSQQLDDIVAFWGIPKGIGKRNGKN